jgi:hypothetical protein
MQKYDFKVDHIAGALHVVPDALSRLQAICMMTQDLIPDTDLWLKR